MSVSNSNFPSFVMNDKAVSFDSHHVCREHSAEEWGKRRGRITQLYITEDKTLRDVKSIMETKFDFCATERQYKQRVKKWSLEKNIKDSDMKVILRKQMKRKLENDKESDFTIHGQPVQQHKIERYKQRKKVSPEEYMASTAPTPPHISCLTPPSAENISEYRDASLDASRATPIQTILASDIRCTVPMDLKFGGATEITSASGINGSPKSLFENQDCPIIIPILSNMDKSDQLFHDIIAYAHGLIPYTCLPNYIFQHLCDIGESFVFATKYSRDNSQSHDHSALRGKISACIYLIKSFITQHRIEGERLDPSNFHKWEKAEMEELAD